MFQRNEATNSWPSVRRGIDRPLCVGKETVAHAEANRQNAANRGHWLNRCEERK